MPDSAHVITGRCTTVFEGTREQRGSATERRTGLAREQEQHGDMLVVIKPDSTK